MQMGKQTTVALRMSVVHLVDDHVVEGPLLKLREMLGARQLRYGGDDHVAVELGAILHEPSHREVRQRWPEHAAKCLCRLHEQLATMRHEQDSQPSIRSLGTNPLRVHRGQKRLSEAGSHDDQGARPALFA